MLKSLIILIFLCPSVWGAAEVDPSVPPFRADGTLDETLVPVHGIVHVPQFFLIFYAKVKDLSVENAKAMQAGAENAPHTIPELKWFLNDNFRTAFLRHQKPICDVCNAYRKDHAYTQFVKGSSEEAIFNYIGSFRSLLNALVQDIDDYAEDGLNPEYTKEEVENAFLSALDASCFVFISSMERSQATLSTLASQV